MDTLSPGTPVGSFVIESVLGSGGMGVVYRGRDEGLERAVAVKVLIPRLAGDPELVERMVREARAMAKIDHPNIVGVYATGEVGGTRWIAMQYVDGGTLKDLLRRESPLDVGRALRIARDVAAALDCAHRAGIVHRDIKPDNIMLDAEGRVKVADFGLARPLTAPVLTAPDAYVGTPRYSAPEQWLSGQIDARTDLYALGVVLYEMLSGRPPFDAEAIPVILRQVLDEAPPPIDAPAPVAALLERLLAKSPDDRPATAREVTEQIDGLLASDATVRWGKGDGAGASSTAAVGGTSVGGIAPSGGEGRSTDEARSDGKAQSGGRGRSANEARPEGGASTRGSDWPAGAAPPGSRKPKPWLWAAAAVLVLAVVAAAFALRPREASGPLVACVLDFENYGGSGDIDWMRVGAPDLLVTSLARYPFLRLLSRDSVPRDHRRDPAAVRQLGAEALISGRYLRTGPTDVLVDLKLLDARDGSVLGAEQVRAGADPDSLLSGLDDLAGRLARRLGSRYEQTRVGVKLGDDAFAAGEGLTATLFAQAPDAPGPKTEAPPKNTAPAPSLAAPDHSGGKTNAPARPTAGGGGRRPAIQQSDEGEQPVQPTSETLAVPTAQGAMVGNGTADHPRLKALALYYRALEIEQDGGSHDECATLLRQALALAPGLVPARNALSRLESR